MNHFNINVYMLTDHFYAKNKLRLFVSFEFGVIELKKKYSCSHSQF